MIDREYTGQEAVVLMGLPASGKSTLAMEYARAGYQVHSSDAMRKRLYGDEAVQGEAAKVFSALHKEIRQDLALGLSVVYDATNLTARSRRTFLQEIAKFSCRKIGVLVLASPEACLKRDGGRDRKVGKSVIAGMLRRFSVPMLFEGYDEIRVVYDDESPYVYDPALARGFDQENGHHRLTLDAHMEAAGAYAREQGFPAPVIEAADYHDIGKLYTKVHHNMRGQETEEAHFYGHESYGAYLYLVWRWGEAFRAGGGQVTPERQEEIFHIAFLIENHMRASYVWRDSEKARERDRALMGEALYEELLQISACDRAAH